jgi:hypothetical protein
LRGGKTFDARYVSLAVFDFNLLQSAKPPKVFEMAGFAPLAFDANGKGLNLALKTTEAPNKDVFFRVGYSTAIGVAQQGCVSSNTELADPNLKDDGVLAAESDPGGYSQSDPEHVLQFSGWQALADDLRALPVRSEDKHFLRQLTAQLTVSIYSKKKGVEEIDTNESSSIRRFLVQNIQGVCVPFWTRTEKGRASPGKEKSRLSQNFRLASNRPALFEIPVQGSMSLGAFTLLGETPLQNRSFAFTTSYSYGDIIGFEVKPKSFSQLR